MMVEPIIPVWLMAGICVGLIIAIRPKKEHILRILMVGMLFLINLRVMRPVEGAEVQANNLDVLFVVDNTISMNAEDYAGGKTRLEAVKEDCGKIIEELGGARFSLITFNNSARIVTPYTQDMSLTGEAIEATRALDELYAKGSSLNTPRETMLESLTSAEKKEGRKRVVFFVSDGEITDDSTLESYKDIAGHVDGGAVLGYGTAEGGFMKAMSGTAEEYVYDFSNGAEKGVSKIDEGNLKKIAEDMGVEYIHMEKQEDVAEKLREIRGLAENEMTENKKRNYEDTYYFAVIGLVGLMMAEIWRMRR